MTSNYTCDSCKIHTTNAHGAVINGEYGQYCSNCLDKQQRMAGTHAAEYSRQRQWEDYAREIIQPYTREGKPNTEFIRQYPEEAEEEFTKEELEQYG